jgi:two-component system sensor histidine kinase/response regulator
MLTAGGQRGDAARCRELGISAYLTKPIRQSELLDAILTVLGKSSQKEEHSALVTRHSLRESRQRRRILLAEDNQVNQKLLVHLLENRGHTVVVAANGREALAALERERFDVVLLDVQMPEIDGIQTTAAIRQWEQQTGTHLPIIALTAQAMPGDRERCLQAGMDGYIARPIRADALFTAIESLMTPPDAAEIDPLTPEMAAPIFDLAGALAHVDGDMALLQEIAAMFRHDCPHLMSKIQAAISSNDSEALMRAAHSLKGGVGIFTTTAPFAAALRLEMMGYRGDLLHAPEAYVALEAEVSRLTDFLARLEQ